MEKGDKVITSKGRFGIITDINGIRATVTMGIKNVEILLKELKPYLATTPLNVWYIDKFDAQQKELSEIIFVENDIILYNSKDPYKNQLLDTVNISLAKRLNNNDLIITKIKFVK